MAMKLIVESKCFSRILRKTFHLRYFASAKNVESIEPDFDTDEYERKLAKIRDCSGLNKHQKLKHHGKMPDMSFLETYRGIKRNKLRRLYSKHGSDSGINPGIMYPSRAELADLKQIEQEWTPTFQQMMSNLTEKKLAEAEAAKQREENVDKAMAKMNLLIKQYEQRKKKEVENEEKQNERIEKLLEEFRETYGFRVTANSPQFRVYRSMKKDEEKELKKKQRKEEKKETNIKNLKELLGKEVAPKS